MYQKQLLHACNNYTDQFAYLHILNSHDNGHIFFSGPNIFYMEDIDIQRYIIVWD